MRVTVGFRGEWNFNERGRETGVSGFASAYLEEDEFLLARTMVSGISSYQDYGDWLDVQEGLNFGLEMAGFCVTSVKVNIVPFLNWCRLNSKLPSESLLKDYAKRISDARKNEAVDSASEKEQVAPVI